MKLTKGVTVRHQGQTYRNECPDDVAEAVDLKAVKADIPKPKKEAKP